MARPKPRSWIPKNPQKYSGDPSAIVARSSWEVRFMNWCDMNSNVVKWASEELPIPYMSPVDGKPHRYFPDFIIKVKQKDGSIKTVMVEVKPHKETQPPTPCRNKRVLMEQTATYMVNQAKWRAAEDFCRKKGWEFTVVTEYHLGLKK